MALQLKIDQAGKPPGIAGQARQDLATGVAALLTAVGGPFLSYRWTVISKAIDIAVPVRSAAVFATPTSVASLLSPIDLPGGYLVQCAVDSGQGLGANAEDVVQIDFYAGPPLADVPGRLPRRRPAAFEQLSHNVPDALDPSGNTEGWAREWLKWFQILQNATVWAEGYIENNGGMDPAVLVRGFGVSVANVGVGMVQVTFDTPMPDAYYAVFHNADVLGAVSLGPIITEVALKDANGFQLYTYDPTIPAYVDGPSIAFSVKLGLP